MSTSRVIVDRELIDALRDSTKAIVLNSASTERLTEQAAAQIATSTKMFDLLLARGAMISKMAETIADAPGHAMLVRDEIKLHVTKEVADGFKDALGSVKWYLLGSAGLLTVGLIANRLLPGWGEIVRGMSH